MDKEELISYWIEGSDKDFGLMIHLYKKKYYNWSLFFGHLVTEKLLKALYVKNIDIKHPYDHDLLRLALKAKLELNEAQKDILDMVSTFNIRARYDDFKFEFYKICTKEFTKEWIDKIKEFRTWIKQQF
jgi:HEPN domain-containing protein